MVRQNQANTVFDRFSRRNPPGETQKDISISETPLFSEIISYFMDFINLTVATTPIVKITENTTKTFNE